MSKYTEAKGLIKKLYYEEDYCLVPELAEALDLAIEALEIADRLEQADFINHKKHYRNIEDSEWEDGYETGFVNGYSRALADIRGDTE